VARGHEISASAGISKSGAKIQTTKFGHLWLCGSDRFNFRRLLKAPFILDYQSCRCSWLFAVRRDQYGDRTHHVRYEYLLVGDSTNGGLLTSVTTNEFWHERDVSA
jgi:hypothetical protein